MAANTLLRFILLLAYVSYCLTQQCSVSSTEVQFISYLRGFTQCRIGPDVSTFQDEFPLLNQVLDFDGKYVANGFQADALDEYCRKVQACKSEVTACESSLGDFVQAAGTALCQNGVAMTQTIESALSVLAGTDCVLFAAPDDVSNDGCFLVGDKATPSTYLHTVQRRNKKEAATSRCVSRYNKAQGRCPSDVISALATVEAASKSLESIGSSFDSHSIYQKPALSSDRTLLSARGFMHLYKNQERVESCALVGQSSTLLWNTYLRVVTSNRLVEPMAESYIITGVVVDFADDAGRILDSYMTYTSNSGLAAQTSHQQADTSTDIKLAVVSDNSIVLYHPGINTHIVVSRSGQSLSVVVNLPTSLLNLETFGLLAEGCAMFGASSVSSLGSSVTAQCRENCTAHSEVNKYLEECAYDCSNGINQYTISYSEVNTQVEAANRDFTEVVSAAAHTSGSVFVYVALLTTLYLWQ